MHSFFTQRYAEVTERGAENGSRAHTSQLGPVEALARVWAHEPFSALLSVTSAHLCVKNGMHESASVTR